MRTGLLGDRIIIIFPFYKMWWILTLEFHIKKKIHGKHIRFPGPTVLPLEHVTCRKPLFLPACIKVKKATAHIRTSYPETGKLNSQGYMEDVRPTVGDVGRVGNGE